jgi:hypothetical protein
VRRVLGTAGHMRHQHNSVVGQLVESKHVLWLRQPQTSVELDTIPIKYYFRPQSGRIQDRDGMDSSPKNRTLPLMTQITLIVTDALALISGRSIYEYLAATGSQKIERQRRDIRLAHGEAVGMEEIRDERRRCGTRHRAK